MLRFRDEKLFLDENVLDSGHRGLARCRSVVSLAYLSGVIGTVNVFQGCVCFLFFSLSLLNSR